MQVLWSRAAQTGSSCRCSSCLHSATAIARRTTTAATKRRLKAGDIFTACYSTILASAAIADAKVKDERRKEWDRVIAEAKAGKPINEPDAVGRTQAASGSFNSKIPSNIESKFEDYEGASRSNQPITTWNGANWTVTRDTPLESKLRSLDMQVKQSLGRTTRLAANEEVMSTSRSDQDLEDEWVDGELDVRLPFREPNKRLHLDKMETMVANLVDQLLLKTKAFSGWKFEGASTTCNLTRDMRDMAQRIAQLREGFTHLPAYSWESSRSVEEKRSALHRSLFTVCKKTTPSRSSIDLMLAKICYNLLVSTTPPSIATYNILIGELSRLEQHDIAQVVVDSFFYDSKFTPTSKTVRLILNHYSAKRDPKGFQTVINRMRATDGDMRIKRRVLYFLCDPKVQEWAQENKVIHRGNYLSSKMPRDGSIFDSIISGCLQMKGVRPAIRYIRAALREGQQVRAETLCTVIKACVAQLDYRAGESLLKTILSLWRDGKTTALVRFSSDVRYGIHQLLGLCGIDSSLGAKQTLPHYLAQDGLQSLLRHMQLESLHDAVEQFAERILSLGSALRLDCPRASSVGTQNHQGVQDALQILRRHSKGEKRRMTNREQSGAQVRWIKLRVLDLKVNIEEERIIAKEAQLLPIIYQSLSDPSQQKYDARMRLSQQLSHHMSITSKLDLLLHLDREEKNQSEPASNAPASVGSANTFEKIEEEVMSCANHTSSNSPQQYETPPLAVQMPDLSVATSSSTRGPPGPRIRDGTFSKEYRSSTNIPSPTRSPSSALSLPPFHRRVELDVTAG